MRDGEAVGWIEEWFEAGVEIVRDSDDAYLAAIAISRGASLASFDEDFRPFVRHGLRWERLGAS